MTPSKTISSCGSSTSTSTQLMAAPLPSRRIISETALMEEAIPTPIQATNSIMADVMTAHPESVSAFIADSF